ncbi:hypothetical protein QCA50_007311 [Cerrena zonata]|uniref:CCHC-type domain-containing protein n=1 Tax=Cerrena zonata TaxID=2478898 RepID=A0AAW0GCX7_9APHY
MSSTPLCKPAAYDGQPELATTYTLHCQLAFALSPTVFDTDQRKKAYLLSFCTKNLAATWSEEVITEWMRIPTKKDPTPELSWSEAVTAFETKFCHPDIVADAIVRLYTLRQGSDFESFLAKFKRYQICAGYTTVSHIRQTFLQALEPHLASLIKNLRVSEVDTPDKLYTAARDFYNQDRLDRASSRSHQYQRKINRVQSQTLQVSPQQRNDLDRRLCFRCHRSGHFANACPRRTTPVANHHTRTAKLSPAEEDLLDLNW